MARRAKTSLPIRPLARTAAVTRTRWLFEFARLPLLPPERPERTRLRSELLGYLDVGPGIRNPGIPGAGQVDDASLQQCHEWLKNGFDALARGQPWNIRYTFPPSYVVRLSPPSIVARTGIQDPLIPLKQVVYEEAVPLVLRYVRICERTKCQTLFWRRGRQRYCSGKCSGQARTRKWRQKNPQQVSRRRRARYEARVRSRLPPAAKVTIARRVRRPAPR
jgi:hypothetical protein